MDGGVGTGDGDGDGAEGTLASTVFCVGGGGSVRRATAPAARRGTRGGGIDGNVEELDEEEEECKDVPKEEEERGQGEKELEDEDITKGLAAADGVRAAWALDAVEDRGGVVGGESRRVVVTVDKDTRGRGGGA